MPSLGLRVSREFYPSTLQNSSTVSCMKEQSKILYFYPCPRLSSVKRAFALSSPPLSSNLFTCLQSCGSSFQAIIHMFLTAFPLQKEASCILNVSHQYWLMIFLTLIPSSTFSPPYTSMPSSSNPISWKYSLSTMKHPINAGLLEE